MAHRGGLKEQGGRGSKQTAPAMASRQMIIAFLHSRRHHLLRFPLHPHPTPFKSPSSISYFFPSSFSDRFRPNWLHDHRHSRTQWSPGSFLVAGLCDSTASSLGATRGGGKEEATALQMIDYARALKGNEANYAEAVRVLEQGLSFFTGHHLSSANAAGRVQLTLATIHANRENFGAAIEVLQHLVDMTSASLVVRVAALEALTGLCLQTHQDDAALGHAHSLLGLLKTVDDDLDSNQADTLLFRAAAVRGLVELAYAQEDNVEPYTDESKQTHSEDAGAILAYAEILHVHGRLAYAQEFYKKAILLAKAGLENSGQVLSAVGMTPEEVYIGGLAGLGQLLTLQRSYQESEERLTEALKQVENIKGEGHPQVGFILSCLGDSYWRGGKVEDHADPVLAEALYQKALYLLKAPPLDQHDNKENLEYKELIALTRAHLSAVLATSESRRNEADRLMQWAQAAWKNPIPLTETLPEDLGAKSSDETKKERYKMIDVRLGRVF
eukprot:c19449_g1_i2 orf=61-1557(+)